MKQILLTFFAICAFTFSYAQPPAGNAAKGDLYGDSFTSSKAIKGKTLEKKLKSESEVATTIKGKVIEVCPKKGCWIKLELDNKTIATVKMKDYGFFVPTALEGKNILIDGKAEMVTSTVSELRHIAEDAKKSKEEIAAITEPKTEMKIMANGIKVVD